MTTFQEAIKQQSRVILCNLLGGPSAVPYLGSPVGSIVPEPIENLVQRARRWTCNDRNDEVITQGDSPFDGGQCPGILYRVSGTNQLIRANGAGDVFNYAVNVYGPVIGTGTTVTDNFFAGFVRAHNAGGSPSNFNVVSSSGDNTGFNRVVSINVTISGIQRLDGQPDNCGDPPGPPLPPYVPVPVTVNITYIDIDNIEVTEEGDFTVLAPIFIAGNIIAPITFEIGEVSGTLEFNLGTGDITFDFGSGDTSVEVEEENPVENPTDDEPEIEENSVFYGLVIYSVPEGNTPPVTSSWAQSQAPTLQLPRTGNCWFQVAVGDRVSWVGPIPVQAENQLIMVPWGLAATGYRLVANTGWTLVGFKVGKPPCGCVSG